MKQQYRLALAGLVMSGAFFGCGDDGTSGSGGAAAGAGIKVQVSGEDLATSGFRFPTGSEVAISDGWEVQFDHVFVSIGKVEVFEGPDTAPTDQSKTGAKVAALEGGPWIVDLAKDGGEPGAGGEGRAVLLGVIADQNANGGKPFASDERYAFSYATAVPSASSKKINLSADSDEYVAEMQAKGYVLLMVGRGTFKGTSCETGDDAYFATFPTEVEFAVGFATPTEYINCQNADNQGQPFDGEEYQRGLSISASADALAQLTFHVDHPFYSEFAEEPRLYFDAYAAAMVGKPANTVLTIDDLNGIDPTALTDAGGAPLPFRVCDGSDAPTVMQRSYGTASVPVNPAASPNDAIRHYADYIRYVQSTQAHMNGGEGLCFVKRGYPSPP
jgi:hypothetical protein